jgi:hypothetical protein
MFDSDPITPSYETKCVLLSRQVDHSHVFGGICHWPFTVAFPTASVPSLSTSSETDSSLGHQPSNIQDTGSDLKFQLIVTIYRRGRLYQNIGFVITISCNERSLTLCFGFRLKQKISYVLPPDPSVRSSTLPLPPDLLHDPPAVPSWPMQTFPVVCVRGVMFRQIPVEVECQVSNRNQIIPSVLYD